MRNLPNLLKNLVHVNSENEFKMTSLTASISLKVNQQITYSLVYTVRLRSMSVGYTPEFEPR